MAEAEPPLNLTYAAAPTRNFPRWLVATMKFAVVMAVCTMLCTIIWQTCVADVLYHCSDALGLDYLQGPGGWVHGAAAAKPGNFGDTIRPGWTLPRLEALWFSLLAGSAALSVILSRVRWSAGSRLSSRALLPFHF